MTLTKVKLASLMMAIPVWEIAGGSPSRAPSPMTLSRGDRGRWLYSGGTEGGARRAHWNPGVGLFQLDFWDPIVNASHGQRAGWKGRTEVARYLRDVWCEGNAAAKAALRRRWVACDTSDHRCWTSYQDLYNPSTDTANKELLSQYTEWDGGVKKMTCRWGSSGVAFDCHWYDVEDDAEGYAVKETPSGDSILTPLAYGFFSFTWNGSIHAHWLRSETEYSDEWRKRVPFDTNPRDVDGWATSSDLEWLDCTPEPCRWRSD